MKIGEIIGHIEEFAPLCYQESYDNSGLIVGDLNKETDSAILCVDITEDVIDEAILKKINLIISHHPIIFSGLKKITGKTQTERVVAKAIKNDIALYAAHTNLDNVVVGVNAKMCAKLGLKNCNILSPMKNALLKIVVFVPVSHAEKLRWAMSNAGAGNIGNYSDCCFYVDGKGTFKANEIANPFVGKTGELHTENEVRIETIVPKSNLQNVVKAIRKNHPYEEIAYDIYELNNDYTKAGAGMIGELPNPISYEKFIETLKKVFSLKVVRATKPISKNIFKVAVCGGAGSFLLGDAIEQGADIFVSGDFKYHQFFDAEGKISIADIGHFESEQFTIEIFCDIIKEKISNFTPQITEINTNPIIYNI